MGEKTGFHIGNVYTQFCGRVESQMANKEIDEKTLVNRTGLSRPTIARLLEGTGNPLVGNLDLLARAFGVPIEEILGPATSLGANDGASSGHPLIGQPPLGDQTALWIYKQLCAEVDFESLKREVIRCSYPLPGEIAEEAIDRAVLDVFHFRQAWIHAYHVPRAKKLEARIAKRYDLPAQPDLNDPVPVRVIDLPETMHKLLRIFAVAAVAAEVSREVMQRKRTLGIGDGFSTAAWQVFMRRGALSNVALVPLVIAPDFTQFELNGNSIIASIMRTHLGYDVGSAIELDDLKSRISEVDHAVVSCGPGLPERNARLPRLIKASKIDYSDFFARLKKRSVAGDLLYHFLSKRGTSLKVAGITGDLSKLDKRELRGTGPKPLVYTTPLEELADIADRGVSLVQSHQADRAPVLKAALSMKRPPVNFLVITRGIAEGLLE